MTTIPYAAVATGLPSGGRSSLDTGNLRFFRSVVTRSLKKAAKKSKTLESEIDAAAAKLLGWEEFDGDGLLR
jgi:hypothetical protein